MTERANQMDREELLDELRACYVHAALERLLAAQPTETKKARLSKGEPSDHHQHRHHQHDHDTRTSSSAPSRV